MFSFFFFVKTHHQERIINQTITVQHSLSISLALSVYAVLSQALTTMTSHKISPSKSAAPRHFFLYEQRHGLVFLGRLLLPAVLSRLHRCRESCPCHTLCHSIVCCFQELNVIRTDSGPSGWAVVNVIRFCRGKSAANLHSLDGLL